MFRNRITTWYLGAVLLTAIVLVAMGGSVALADFTFGEPTNLGPSINGPAMDAGPCPSADGKQLYFNLWLGMASQIWVSQRAAIDSAWEPPLRLGPPFDTETDSGPFITSDGLSLYYDSSREGGFGTSDLWVATRATVNDKWGTPVNLGATVNTTSEDWAPNLSADGLELYFVSNRPDGFGTYDLWVTSRATVKDDWGTPVNLGATLNTEYEDTWPGISADGLVLFFCSSRPGGFGAWDLYMTKRPTRTDPWGPPSGLGPTLNSTVWQGGPKVSLDGSTLYFYSARPGGSGEADLWQAAIIPTVDFSGDKKVDLVDLVMLIDNWGTNKTLCDIGPMPWGDGKVDIEDLKVFMTYYEKENPPAKP